MTHAVLSISLLVVSFQVSVPIIVAIKGKNTRCVTVLLEKLGGHVSISIP